MTNHLFLIVWVLIGLATIHPYYLIVIKGYPGREQMRYKDLDPILFPLVVICLWPVALLTILIAYLVKRDMERMKEEEERFLRGEKALIASAPDAVDKYKTPL